MPARNVTDRSTCVATAGVEAHAHMGHGGIAVNLVLIELFIKIPETCKTDICSGWEVQPKSSRPNEPLDSRVSLLHELPTQYTSQTAPFESLKLTNFLFLRARIQSSAS